MMRSVLRAKSYSPAGSNVLRQPERTGKIRCVVPFLKLSIANTSSDLQHVLMGVTLGKLHLAPIDPTPQNVVDIATGQQPTPERLT
jgi:hypothetical protein